VAIGCSDSLGLAAWCRDRARFAFAGAPVADEIKPVFAGGAPWLSFFFLGFRHDNGFAPFGPFFFFGGLAANSAAFASRSFNSGSFGRSQSEGLNFLASFALESCLDAAEGSSREGTWPLSLISGTPGTRRKL
jgi:hypothetical protein